MTIRARRAAWTWLAVGFLVGPVRTAVACDATPPVLTARQVGANVVLDWTGTLGPGDAWIVERGDLDVLRATGPNEVEVASVGVPTYVDVGATLDAEGTYDRVYCDGPSGQGPVSNMAVELALTLTTRSFGTETYPNILLVQLPERLGLPDVADASAADPCAPLAGVGDGVLTPEDLLCGWATAPAANLMLTQFDGPTCRSRSRTIFEEPGGCGSAPALVVAGGWTSSPVPGDGVAATITPPAGATSLTDRLVIVGATDPAASCQTIAYPALGCAPSFVFLKLPYDARDRTADEILCGREGRDWVDADGDGWPDTCPSGIFDGARGVTLEAWDDVNGYWMARTVRLSFRGGLQFVGPSFALRAGASFVVAISPGHTPTTYCPERY